ncbi:MAG: hypothetical protein AAFP86_10565, partial [Planctomycetota bacterium]
MRDAWEDDDRVGRLLARRAAEQEAERRAAVERYGDGARPAATQLVQDPPARARQAPGTAPSSDTGPS